MSFESEFFGLGNRLRWDAICTGSLAADVKARLGPFLDDLIRAPDVLVLPRVREDDGRVQWYVLCASARVARVARDELRAFLGPSYSDFEGFPTDLDPSDGVEAAVLSRCGSSAFRVEVPQRDLLNAARERLLLLTRLRGERPVRSAQRVRAAGRILRDFEYALIANDGQATAECIEELRNSGQLGATNLLFLEVRRLAALGQWDAILALPEIGSLLAMARPRRVTVALIRAVYVVQLQEFEVGFRARDALDRFQSVVLPRFRDLFRTHAGLSGYEVDASFLLASAASDPPRPDLVEAVLVRNPEGAVGHSYLAALAGLVPVRTTGTAPIDSLMEAQEAFVVADVDRAYELAVLLSPSFEACALVLRCAREMGTLAAARSALGAVDRLSEAERARLNGHAILRRIRDGLSAFAISARAEPTIGTTVLGVPTSWAAWLRRLQDVQPWKSAVAVAEMGAREWNLDTLLSDAGLVIETAELILGERPLWGQLALRDALPHFLEFLLSRSAHPGLKPVYENLFLAIAVDEQVSLPQLSALIRTAETRLQLGVSKDEYREILAHLAGSLDRAGSPAVSDLALEAVDVLVSETCPDTREREDFVARVGAMFQRWYRRIDAAQWTLLRQLADELQVPDAVSRQAVGGHVADVDSAWTALRGKKVALYSLREPALRRVQLVLEALCPGIRVEVFSDRVGGSPALRAASATSDVFVVATAAAKHAATLYIDANRARTRVTLYARGQGSASLLEAIREFLKQSSPGNVRETRGESGSD